MTGSAREGGWLLWYESPSLPFRVPKDLPCHSRLVDGVTVTEQHRADAANPYGLRLERLVRTQPELSSAKKAVIDLDKPLRRVWPYIAGAPMTIRQSRLIVSLHGPIGWRTNHRDLYEQIPGARLNPAIGNVISEFFITLTLMPLESLLDALPAFQAADSMTSTLIDLHLDTWNHYQHGVEIFLFAKTMELALALLPGTTMTQKQNALPQPFAASLTKDLEWLKRIANTRIDARHAVNSRAGLQLHPRMNQEERLEFINNADLAIRGVISSRLGIDLNTIKRPK